tara:strand:+ start:12648 stop:13004 length:357 start_codon:yes stop_codon:yes gene_type:complete
MNKEQTDKIEAAIDAIACHYDKLDDRDDAINYGSFDPDAIIDGLVAMMDYEKEKAQDDGILSTFLGRGDMEDCKAVVRKTENGKFRVLVVDEYDKVLMNICYPTLEKATEIARQIVEG